MPRAFNIMDTLLITDAGKYASHLHSMLVGTMLEASARHRLMAYARCVWPCVGIGPMHGQRAGPGISDDMAFPDLPNCELGPHPRGYRWQHRTSPGLVVSGHGRCWLRQ
jgi:hypothetical protein